jgi:hypothetical protein
MKNVYTSEGWFNADLVLKGRETWYFCVGGRGTGKTYGMLKACVESGVRFALLRRTQLQLDTACNPNTSVFKVLNVDLKREIVAESAAKNSYVWKDKEDETIVGYAFALSTISNIRGFDGSDIDIIIYDEFVPERHEKRMRNEYDALMNAYSTINRNRELVGRAPVKMVCLANANNIANQIFIGADLVGTYEMMIRKHMNYYKDYKRNMVCMNLFDSPISEKQKETALYKFTRGSDFSAMAFDNAYAYNDFTHIKKAPLVEYQPLVTVGDITIMRHKSRPDDYYITAKRVPSGEMYSTSTVDIKKFALKYNRIYLMYIDGMIKFDGVLAENLFCEYVRGGVL